MHPSARSVCVIGAQGVLGAEVVRQFESAGWKVRRAGRRPERREGFRQLDLDRHEVVAPALRDVDLVVSTVPHPGWTAERAVLRQGGVLVNCSHAPGRVAAAIAVETKEPKGTVLLNAGLVPGVANLVAAELLGEHPRADCLEVAFTVLSAGTAGRAGGEFAHHGLTSQRNHRVVALPMPEPFGRLSFIETAEGEDGGFGGVAGQCAVETYLGFGDRPLSLVLRTVNALRLNRVLPRAAFALDRRKGPRLRERRQRSGLECGVAPSDWALRSSSVKVTTAPQPLPRACSGNDCSTGERGRDASTLRICSA